MKPILTSALLLLGLLLTGQTPISGIINQYAAVTGIEACAGRLTVDDAAGFAAGQSILIIQMQGAIIDESNSAAFGNLLDLGEAGRYERATIQSVAGDDLFLEELPLNAYDLSGRVQVVSLPVYQSAIVTAPLTAAPWNGSTGGVLALEVIDTLTLHASLSVEGQGFRGGAIQVLASNCQFFLDYNDYYYNLGNWRGARKGEGVAAYLSDKEAGRGAQANGGGGGNDHNTGGGGGAHLQGGGQGGEQSPNSVFSCQGPYPGLGGKALTPSADRLFLGGGGGAGHTNNAGAGSDGGNGGGILFLLAGAVDGQGHALLAGGADAIEAGGDGGGGGGAGGTVVFRFETLLSALSVDLAGGKGASTDNLVDRCYGPGGGGSGGRLLFDGAGLSGIDLDGGAAGVNLNASSACSDPANGATAGTDGQSAFLSDIPGGATPNQPFAIATQPPASINACLDSLLQLSLVATGNSLQYQWQIYQDGSYVNLVEGAEFQGVQSPVLTIPNVPAGLEGAVFRCVLTDLCGDQLHSATTLLQVIPLPTAGFDLAITGLYTVQFANLSTYAQDLLWDFGDGNSSTETDPEHIFAGPGSYLITLSVQNACGSSLFSDTLELLPPAVADFDLDFSGGCVPFDVQFSDLSTGMITSWEWSFPGGDPASSDQPNPTVTYNTPGLYDVSLTVSNAQNSDQLTLTGLIEALPFPTADFSFVLSGDTVFFTNLSSPPGLSYQWTFGDGSAPSAQTNPLHVYPDTGLYEVSLVVNNTYCGSVASATVEIVPTAVSTRLPAEAIGIRPNPTGGLLYLSGLPARPTAVRLWDLRKGNIRNWEINGPTGTVDLEGLPPGLYLLEVRLPNGAQWTKVVKN